MRFKFNFQELIFLKPQKYAHKIIPRISNIDITKNIKKRRKKT